MMQLSFGGQTISKPGAYSVVNTQSHTVVEVGNQRVLLFMGAANGGQPQTVLYFNNPDVAKATLRGGDAINAMNLAWNPSKDVFVNGVRIPAAQGADLIGFIRTDEATQATLALKDSTTAPGVTGVTLTSKIYGTDGNAVTVTIGAGTNTNTQKVTFTDPAGVLTTEVYDNLPTGTGIFQTLVNQVNGAVAGIAASNFFTAAIGTSTDTKFATGTFNPSGATQTAGTATDFTNALTLAQNEAVDGIVALTSAQAIQASVQSHVDTMSSTLWKRERRAFTGSATGESAATSVTNAKAFNDSRVTYVRPGGYQTINGTKTLFGGYMVACMVAGIWAGQAPNQSTTFKYLNLTDIEMSDSLTDQNTLLNSGVTPIEKAFGIAGGFRVVQGLTTSTATNPDGTPNLVQQLLEVASVVDYVAKDFRTNMQNKWTGTSGSNTTAAEMTSTAVSLLEGYVSDGYLVNGQDPNTGKYTLAAYTAPTVTQNGNQYSASFQGRPSVEVDYELFSETFAI